jgi:3-deoxy-D-manno-octulosonic-acid transferase
MLPIYNILSLIALLIYLPKLLARKGPEDRRAYIYERLGISEYVRADIWIHAVSVGEVTAAIPFLKALKKVFPSLQLVLSTTTYTGQKVARDSFPEANRVMYMPWDTGVCISRVVKALKPKLFITIETELWPVLFEQLIKAGTRIIVLNGRLSQDSFRGYRFLKPFMKNVLRKVEYFYMQGKGDVERIISIGADPLKVGLMGNFKFDIDLHLNESTAEWLQTFEGRVLVAGSTHKGEEEIVLDAYKDIKERVNDIILILAPRHPERFKDVEETIKNRGMQYIKRTELKSGSEMNSQMSASDNNSQRPASLKSYDVILLDTIGELSRVYATADVTFVGGSLKPFGGHNILEPAYWGKPVLFGPHMDNFPIAADFLRDGAALEVKDAGSMTSAVLDVLNDREKAGRIGRKAREIVQYNTGAVERALQLIRSTLGTV